MRRSILVGGAIAACAVGMLFWWLFDESGAPADRTVVAGSDVDRAATTESGNGASSSSTAATADAEAARMAISEDAARAKSGLPWVAELGRATGRVVDSSGRPRAQCVVRTLQRREANDSRGSFDPEPESAPPPSDTRTDTDGRFTSAGLLPRERYLLVLDPSGSGMSVAAEVIGPELGATTELGDVVLADAASLTGRVVRADGTAVSGATVAIPESGVPGDEWLAYFAQQTGSWAAFPFPLDRPLTQTTLVPRTTTDADGKFTLTGMFRADDVLLVRAPERVAQVFARTPESSDLGTLTLAGGESIRGIARGHGGPMADAAVFVGTLRDPSAGAVDASAEPDAYAWSMSEELRVRRALARSPRADLALLDPVGRTRADGSFTIDDVVLPALVVARASDGETTVVARVESGRDPIDLAPSTTFALTVRLSSSAATPLTGIRLGLVQVVLGDREYNAPIRDHARFDGLAIEEVDATTRVIRGLVPGAYRVQASADGHGTATTSTTITADTTVTLALVPETAIDVHVVDREGVAVVGALVRVAPTQWTEGRAARRRSARTNASGVARVHHLGEFPLAVTVEHPRFATSETTVKEVAERVDVTMERGGTLAIRVHRAGGPPKNRAQVMLARVLEGDDLRYVSHDLIPADGLATLERIAPGKLRVTLTSEPREDAERERPPLEATPVFMQEQVRRDVEVHSDATTTVEFDEREADSYVGPIARIQGRIRVNGGAPPPGLVVVLRLATDYRSLDKVTPDAAGAFVFDEAPAARVIVAIAEARLAGVWTTDEIDERELDLTGQTEGVVEFDLKTGTARGAVVFADDGSPAIGAEVRLGYSVMTGPNSSTSRNRETKTGPTGTYEFSHLIEANYRVSVQHDDAPRQGLTGEFRVGMGGDTPIPTIRLVRGVTVSGRLIDESGKPVATAYGCNIGVRSSTAALGYTWRECTFDAKTGEFKGVGLPAGEASLSIWGAATEFEDVKFSIPPEGATGLVFTVKAIASNDVTVSGRIELPSADAPAIGSMVVWYENTGMGVDVTPLTLAFSASWLRPGSARIEFNVLTSAKYEDLTLEIPPEGLKDVVLRPQLAKTKDG